MPGSDASAPSIALPPRQTAEIPRPSRIGERLETVLDAERNQLPLWLPVGLGSGIATWFWLPDTAAWTAFLLALGALLLGGLAIGGSTRTGKALALFALAAALGCGLIWWKAERVAAPRLDHPRMAEVTARIESAQRLPAKSALRLVVTPADPALAARLRITVDEEDVVPGLDPGETIRFRAWLMPPAPMAVPGAYDFARVAWFQRIGGTGRALDLAVVAPAEERGWRARLADWRQRLADHIAARVAGGEGGIAVALATGDQGAMPEADAEAMRRSGLAHLLSVSGLHLTAVVGAVMLLTLKLLALSPTLALRFRLVLVSAAAGALAGIAYTLLTGAEVPTIRACIAALLVLIGIALGREALTLRLVAVGALVVLLFWPESLAGPSFQLSFAAITAIVALHEHPRVKALLARRDEGGPQKVGRFLLALVLTGLAVEVALAPIALYHFHRTGLYGALANVVAIPLTTFVIMPLEALAMLLDLAGLGARVWWLTERALGWLLGLAHATAAAPGAVASLAPMPAGAFALMIGGGLWLALWRSRWRRLGLFPCVAGAAWAMATPPADLLVTGDGRHVAVRASEGTLAILRPRAGDYVRDLLAETSASQAEPLELDRLPVAACSRDLCIADLGREGRRWRLLATRSRDMVPIEALVHACAEADIVVSDRRLPRTCRPRWLKADRTLLRRTGGLAFTLGEVGRVATVADRVGRHPWAAAP
ncbi:ComEC/Rec2 family competence protein [Sphingomonas sp. LY54]|uniref:ComEC/Rec2 family competence protein n=1 Tax=Sphingomonas sp. LY54 TaxID=3095343 RepID=UPI002D778E09|nr:ComEC/Rec2 family competence protein [Sphingomonas sp. LY54]WRP28676.1 ComEC/Rec2 family competence protein [Sphingomonas sp. LY54]